MKIAVKQLDEHLYEVADLFDPADSKRLTRKQIMEEILKGEVYYGVTRRGRVTVFESINDVISYDNLQRKLGNQPELKYVVDYDDVVLTDVVFKEGIPFDLVIPSFVTSIQANWWRDGYIVSSADSSLLLNSLSMPDSVTEICSGLCECTASLKKLRLSESLSEIPESSFAGTSIEALEIPSSVSIIGDEAFRHSAIRELTLHDGLKRIGALAFSHNTIEKLVIPSSVKFLDLACFGDNPNLKFVSVPRHLKSFLSSAGGLIESNLTVEYRG